MAAHALSTPAPLCASNDNEKPRGDPWRACIKAMSAICDQAGIMAWTARKQGMTVAGFAELALAQAGWKAVR